MNHFEKRKKEKVTALHEEPMLRISVDGGKYAVIQDAGGRLHATRYGEPWRDLVGDNLVLCLAQELKAAREHIASLERQIGSGPKEDPHLTEDVEGSIAP